MIPRKEISHALESHGYNENLVRGLTEEYYRTKKRSLNLFKVFLGGIPLYTNFLYDKYHHLLPQEITNKVDSIGNFLFWSSTLATALLIASFAKKEAKIERIVNEAIDYSTNNRYWIDHGHLPTNR